MDKNEQATRRSNWPLVASLFLLICLVASYFVFPAFQEFIDKGYYLFKEGDKEALSEWIKGFGIWGPVFIIVAMVIQMFLFFVPSPLLMIVSVVLYGPVFGSLLSIAAIMISSTVGYIIGRYLGEATVDRLLGHKKEVKLRSFVERYGVWTVIAARLSPLLSTDAVSFVGGLVKMNYLKYMAATLIGITPLAGLIGYFGKDSDQLTNGLIIISVGTIILLAGYIYYDQKKQRARHETY